MVVTQSEQDIYMVMIDMKGIYSIRPLLLLPNSHQFSLQGITLIYNIVALTNIIIDVWCTYYIRSSNIVIVGLNIFFFLFFFL